MQLHFGAIRNNSPRIMRLKGVDAGGDSAGRTTDPLDIAGFLGDLEREDALPKTIIYNLNPADNTVFSTMAGNFAPKVQFGAAWWFNDHIRGIENQIDELMETGALAASVGMLTDSRSFTSFVRHEYYRRILCRKLGRLMQEGMYPDDEETLGEIVRRVCYTNAYKFFGY
jgi:glucuronate isomerase